MNEFLSSKGLTLGEIAVVTWFMLGKLSNKEIADTMGIGVKTVKFHLTSVYKKLGVKSRTQLMMLLIPYYIVPTIPPPTTAGIVV